MLVEINAHALKLAAIILVSCLFAATSIRVARAQMPEEDRVTPKDLSWIVYYANEASSGRFDAYDIIVFDRDAHPPLQTLKAKGKTILGYISVGEAEKYRADYAAVQNTHALLEENPNWPGHFAVDVRNPEWTRYLVEDVIPPLLRKGFDGIFVDTLDSVEILEQRDPETYKGMIKAAAQTIKTIARHYPNMKIMINRGFAVMPYITDDVHYVLAEGTLVNYDFEDGNHQFFPEPVINEYADKLKALKKQAPHLRIMTLDYWDMDDKETVKEIYRRQRSHGFYPYVTTIELDQIHEEPQ